MQKAVEISESEYADMLDNMERMRETIEVLSNQETIGKLKVALSRIESGEYLTKEDMVF